MDGIIELSNRESIIIASYLLDYRYFYPNLNIILKYGDSFIKNNLSFFEEISPKINETFPNSIDQFYKYMEFIDRTVEFKNLFTRTTKFINQIEVVLEEQLDENNEPIPNDPPTVLVVKDLGEVLDENNFIDKLDEINLKNSYQWLLVGSIGLTQFKKFEEPFIAKLSTLFGNFIDYLPPTYPEITIENSIEIEKTLSKFPMIFDIFKPALIKNTDKISINNIQEGLDRLSMKLHYYRNVLPYSSTVSKIFEPILKFQILTNPKNKCRILVQFIMVLSSYYCSNPNSENISNILLGYLQCLANSNSFLDTQSMNGLELAWKIYISTIKECSPLSLEIQKLFQSFLSSLSKEEIGNRFNCYICEGIILTSLDIIEYNTDFFTYDSQVINYHFKIIEYIIGLTKSQSEKEPFTLSDNCLSKLSDSLVEFLNFDIVNSKQVLLILSLIKFHRNSTNFNDLLEMVLEESDIKLKLDILLRLKKQNPYILTDQLVYNCLGEFIESKTKTDIDKFNFIIQISLEYKIFNIILLQDGFIQNQNILISKLNQEITSAKSLDEIKSKIPEFNSVKDFILNKVKV